MTDTRRKPKNYEDMEPRAQVLGCLTLFNRFMVENLPRMEQYAEEVEDLTRDDLTEEMLPSDMPEMMKQILVSGGGIGKALKFSGIHVASLAKILFDEVIEINESMTMLDKLNDKGLRDCAHQLEHSVLRAKALYDLFIETAENDLDEDDISKRFNEIGEHYEDCDVVHNMIANMIDLEVSIFASNRDSEEKGDANGVTASDFLKNIGKKS